MNDSDDDLTAVAALEEPTRRRLYELIAGSTRPLSRDDAAAALGVPRSTAAFHLDRLADLGLLDVHHARPNGRRGPGAGRPAKFYQRSTRQISVSLPPRHYEIAGRVLASAVEESGRTGQDPTQLLEHYARHAGTRLGRAARPASITDALRYYGFEPHGDDAEIVLGNCPFRTLASEYPTVCGMNLHLIEGLIDGLDQPAWTPRLDPTPTQCCVILRHHPERDT